MRILHVALAFALVRSGAPARGQTPPPRQLFALHSNFWFNLHHFLYATARARKGLDPGRAIGPTALADTAGVGALTAGERASWEGAIAFYDSAFAKRDLLFDSTMVAVNDALATMADAAAADGSTLSAGLAAVLDRAAPVYRKLWWPRHDAENRRWMAAIEPLLQRDGPTIAASEVRLLREPWSPTPVRVDVTAYANWAGAYTTSGPAHITISSIDAGTQGEYALETIFHEVMHTMDDTLFDALKAAFARAGKPLPRDPTHPFIFFTAGELTKRAIAGHVPYAERFGLWQRALPFRQALPALEQSWASYLDGALSFDEAVAKYASLY